MAFPTSSSSSGYDAKRQKYEDIFSAINNGSLSDTDSVTKEADAHSVEELVQFIQEGILNTDPDLWKMALPKLMIMTDAEHKDDLFNRIGAICENRGIKITTTRQDGAASSSGRAPTIKDKIPGQIEAITPEIFRIKCLDQRSFQGGNVTCGYHALKNALVAMAIGEDLLNNPNPHFFEDKALYDTLESNVIIVRGDRLPGTDDDDNEITVAPLSDAWDKIVNNEIPVFPNGDTSLKWNRNGLSIFESINKERLVIADPKSIDYAANLKEFSEKPGPCRQTFIVGGDGHWVTVVCEKDDQQKLRWYGIDSMTDSKTNEHILDAIDILDKALENSDDFAVRQYYERVYQYLESVKTPLQTYDNDIVKNGANFMGRMGWLSTPQDPIIEHFIDQIQRLVIEHFIDQIQRLEKDCNIDVVKDPVFATILALKLKEPNPSELDFAKLQLVLPPTKKVQSAFDRLKKIPEAMKKQDLISSLEIALDEITDPREARSLATAITDNSSLFSKGIDVNDPYLENLRLTAQTVLQNTTEAALMIQNNPYAVVKLHELAQEAQTPEKRLVKIDGELFHYNIGVIDTWNDITYTRGDIPPDISPEIFSDVFRGMEERLGNDPSFEQYISEEQYEPPIESQFKEGVPPTFKKLKNNLIADSYIKKLLRLPEGDSEVILPEQYKLYLIMEELLKADTTIPKGEIVSQREIMLLKFSRYLLFCATGKEEGIRNAYLLVAGEKASRMTTPTERIIVDFTDKFFKGKINEVIDREDFVKALLNRYSIEQRNHQSEFIKRRFGRLVGLKEDIKLDMFTHNLYPEVHSIGSEHFIKTFYQYFDIPVVMEKYTIALREKLSKIIKNRETIAEQGLFTYLQKTFLVPDQEAFEMDEDQMEFIGITPKLTEVVRDFLKLMVKPNLRAMSANEIINFINVSGVKNIDLSECSHLSSEEVDRVIAQTQKLTLDEVHLLYPELQIVDETFWDKHFDIKVDEVPPFDHSAAEMRKVLDQLHEKGVVEGDAGGTLLLLPKGLTYTMIQVILKLMRLSGGSDYYYIKREFGAKANERSRWILLSNNVLNGSRKKSVGDQQKMVEERGGNMPSLLAVIVVLIATYKLQDGKRLFGDTPWTYTRVIEQIEGHPLVVGAFASGGISVYDDSLNDTVYGVALALG